MQVNEHVIKVLRDAIPGDLIEFAGFIYSHWAVYIGDGQIVHVTCNKELFTRGVWNILTGLFKKAVVRVDNLEKYAENAIVVINNSKDNFMKPFPGSEVVKRALKMIGSEGYSALSRNCEHFASCCRYGVPSSTQVVFAIEILFAVGAGVVVGGLVKEALEDKIGFMWACFVGGATGIATTGGILLAMMDSCVVNQIISAGMEKVAEFALHSWGSALFSTVGIGVAVLVGGYLIWKLINSETFKNFSRMVMYGAIAFAILITSWFASRVVSRFESWYANGARLYDNWLKWFSF